MSVDKTIAELRAKIDNFAPSTDLEQIGTVEEISDGIATVSGLTSVSYGELVEFPGGERGLVQNLNEHTIGVVIFGNFKDIKEGDKVSRTGEVMSVPVSNQMLGRVLDPLLQPIDGKAPITESGRYPVEKIAPGVMEREPVNVPLQTGIKAIDSMVPIGRGQRELIIGDRQTGKTTVAIDAILNQHDQDVICVYVAIGQKQSKIARIVGELERAGAMAYTTIVLAGASDGSAYQYLAPYSATALAEYFMDQQKDVLIIYDDLSKHAVAYREMSLLLRRPPGREAYPGDVFYLHSRLLERSARRNEAAGGGSITSLPIIETQAGDISAYIPTNVISITDGQIFLETGLFNKGVRPAINVGNSVSRVGGSAQIKSMKKVAGKLRTQLAQYRELEAFSQFASDLDAATRAQLDRGARLTQLLIQPPYSPVRTATQVALIWAANAGYLDNIAAEDVRVWEKDLTHELETGHVELLDDIEAGWGDDVIAKLETVVTDFMATYKTNNNEPSASGVQDNSSPKQTQKDEVDTTIDSKATISNKK